MYGTALNYTALRLLGVDKDEPMMVRARGTLHALGERTYTMFGLYNFPSDPRWRRHTKAERLAYHLGGKPGSRS